ncbi:MAG: Gfo/Idh/MocA family oxidoreductase [Vicinamibacteraceae bacterium]
MTMRWGILGAARINRSIIPALRAADGHTLEAIASRDADKAAAAAAEWEIPRSVTGYDALLADPDIDAVYIPLPNHLHAEWAVRAAEAGKHVLCEKPLALTVAEVDRITAAAAAANVHVAEAFMYRHHPQTHAVRELVAGGAIGTLRFVRGCFSFTLDRPGDVRFDSAKGGGALWDVGCYPVSYARAVVGAEPETVQASTVIGPTHVDMSVAAILRFPGNVLAVVDASFVAPFRTEVEVVGSSGTIRVSHPFKPGERETVLVIRGDEVLEHVVEAPPLYVSEIEDFGRAARGTQPPVVTLADSRANTATLVAVLESARTGHTVSLDS